MAKIELAAAWGSYAIAGYLSRGQRGGETHYLAIAWCGVMADSPPTIYATLSKGHYTRIGIIDTVPSA